ncbi:hypothetical protein AKJ16_DCAP13425 [Drosera capensis]
MDSAMNNPSSNRVVRDSNNVLEHGETISRDYVGCCLFFLAWFSLAIYNLIVQEGTDNSGVPTKMVRRNSTLKISIYNPASFFGIHVSSTPINLLYSKISVATGQVKKYYQPRKSPRIVSITLEGDKIPLYGAGSSLTVTDAGVSSSSGQQLVPFTLDLEIHSKGYVVGKLVRTKHQLHASCAIEVDYAHYITKLIKFKQDSCSYS